jgi:hypothetical protein
MTAEEIAKLVECLHISGDPLDGDSYALAEHRRLMLKAADALEACAKDTERLNWIIEKRPDLGGWLWIGDFNRSDIDSARKGARDE